MSKKRIRKLEDELSPKPTRVEMQIKLTEAFRNLPGTATENWNEWFNKDSDDPAIQHFQKVLVEAETRYGLWSELRRELRRVRIAN